MTYQRYDNTPLIELDEMELDEELQFENEYEYDTHFENNTEFEELKYNDTYLIKVYQYYLNKGYKNIIIKQIVNLINTSFLVLFTLFLFNCVNFDKLIKIKENTHLYEIIDLTLFFNSSFSILCFIVLMGFVILKLIKLYSSSNNYKRMKDFYNNILEINDNELQQMEWNGIVHKLSRFSNADNINEYIIAGKIMRKENYVVALMSEDVVRNTFITRLIEWNFIYYIINHFFNYNGHLKKDLFISTKRFGLIENIKRRLKIMGFIYLLFMPFIFIFLTFHSIFKYGERFYNKPELLGGRQWNINYKWKIREYNELEHLFIRRLEESKKHTNKYISQFNSKIVDTISRSLIFIISAFLIILVLLSFLNENIFLKLYISENKTTLWYIGVFGTLLTILKSFVIKKIKFEPHKYMDKISECLRHIPVHWKEYPHKSSIKDEVTKNYEYHIILILKECIGVIITPYILYKFIDNIDSITNFIINNTKKDKDLGYICNYSQFNDNIITGDGLYISKLQTSFINFKLNNPDCDYDWSLNNE